jgi:hypothetical protein
MLLYYFYSIFSKNPFMIIKKTSIVIALTTIVTLFVFNACVRERDTDIELVKEEVLGEFIYDNALAIVDDAATKSTGELLANYKTSGYCASIIHDTFSTPRTLVIDFGINNCLCNDGRNRRGQILASYTHRYDDTSNVVTITFDNYYVNDVSVNGQSVVTSQGRNIIGQKYFEIVTEGKMVLLPNADTVYWNAERLRTWVQGQNTPVWGDDIYELQGTGNGKNGNKQYYSMNITEPLIKEVACRYITKGKIEMQPQGKALRSLDYGNGECDASSKVHINFKAFNVDLY